MKLTLREAHRLVTRINTAIRDHSYPATCSINSTHVSAASISEALVIDARDKATAAFKEAIQRGDRLSNIRAQIRNLIGEANQGEINQAIEQQCRAKEAVERLKQIQQSISSARHNNSFSNTSGVTESLRSLKANNSAYSTEVVMCVVPEEEIASIQRARVTAERDVERLTDRLAGLNSSKTITIPQETVDLLSSYDILV